MVVGYVSDFYALLRAVDEAMPKDSTLCLEGTSVAPEVVAFLERRQAPVRSAIAANTLWPKSQFFHLSLAGTDLSQLRQLAEHHAEPEIADHLVVYREGRVLLTFLNTGPGESTASWRFPRAFVARRAVACSRGRDLGLTQRVFGRWSVVSRGEQSGRSAVHR